MGGRNDTDATSERRVHIVDDDAAVRDSLLWLLKSAGLPARAYETAQAFLIATEARPAGCVLLDLRMPGMDGLEALQRLRAHGPSAPVVMMSGHGDAAHATEAMSWGATGLVEKPFAADRLLALVQTLLAAAPDADAGER